MTKRPINIHDQYHAHIYFDEDTLNFASSLCHKAGQLFRVKVGTIHQKLVGPHPCWSCQLSFDKEEFELLIPWLEENRQNLSILVHGLTGNDLEDHTENAYWLGESVPLNLSIFK